MIYEKVLLLEGSGLYQPKELSTVVVNVTGRCVTADGNVKEYERREGVELKLGKSHHLHIQIAELVLFYIARRSHMTLRNHITVIHVMHS